MKWATMAIKAVDAARRGGRRKVNSSFCGAVRCIGTPAGNDDKSRVLMIMKFFFAV